MKYLRGFAIAVAIVGLSIGIAWLVAWGEAKDPKATMIVAIVVLIAIGTVLFSRMGDL